MKVRPIFEFLSGVLIVVFLLGQYRDGVSSPRSLVDYIMPWQPFKTLLIAILIVGASRLIGGKTRDYSGFVYRLVAKIFGLRKQQNEVS